MNELITKYTSMLGVEPDVVIPALIGHSISLLSAIIILIVGWTVAGYVRRLVRKVMRKAKMDETLLVFLSNLLRYGILTFTLIAVLAKFGVQTASLIALMGAAGLAIGLALQGSLSHVASGVMIMIFRPFKIGDYVKIGGYAGTVEDIGLFTTELNTVNNLKLVIPNGQWWGDAIINYSTNTTRRIDMVIGIGYADNMDLAIKTLLAVVMKDARVRETPAKPVAAVVNLGESSVDIQMRFWCKGADAIQLQWDMNKAFKEALDKEGVSIPFPQRDVHLVSQ